MVAAIGLLLTVIWGSRILRERNISPVWIRRLAALRVLAVTIILLILLRPSVHYKREVEIRPDRLILVDTSASMALLDTEDGQTRLENVLRHLRDPNLRRIWLDPFENHWFAFDSHTRSLDADKLEVIRADGTDTRIGAAIEEAWNLYRWSADYPDAEKMPPRLLMISDGIDRGRLDALETALKLGLVVDVIIPSVVQPAPEPKIEITDVQYSQRLLLGSELRIHVSIRQTGFANIPVRLALESEGQRLQSHALRFSGNQTEQRLTMNYRPDVAGIQRYVLKFETDGSSLSFAPDVLPERDLTVRVESHHHEVLVIEPEWRWEFRYLRRVLESDPSFAFSGFLARGPGVYIQFGEPHRRVSLGGFPRTKAELEGFDTLILGDLNPARLPPQLPEAFYELVAHNGRSVVVIAGPNIGSWRRHPRLAALLPVELYPSSSGPLEGPVPVQVSVEGHASPFFFAPEGAASVRRWPQLPPLDQIYAPLRKKPGATILLETPARANEYGPLIVAAVHTVGRGQVLYLATDTLWKWQMKGLIDADGNTPYRVFWQQAMRAIRPERLSATPVHLWLHPDRTHVQAGQTVAVHARIDASTLLPNIRVVGQMHLPDGQNLPLLFAGDPEAPDRFVCRFEASETGLYEIRAEALAGGQTMGEAMTTLNVVGMPAETTPTPPNQGFLEQLATGSGGMRINPQQTDASLPALATASTTTEIREITVNLWSNLWLIVGLTIVLGIDWLIRLMRGYV